MRIQHLARDERGVSFIFVGMSFMAFMAATTLAIDVGMFMTARSQAQNAADGGALAGATALVFNSYTDRSPGGPAVQSAINTARTNLVMRGAPSVVAADVTFPTGPTGLNNRVQVQVYRTAGRSNPVPTLIGPLFGVPTVNINAVAVAEASPANAETCVKPFTIPDKWAEGDGTPWTINSTFDRYDNKGNLLPNPDYYRPPTDPNPTGYSKADIGLELRLKADNNTKITASFYNPWDLPGSVGGNDYRNNIANCNPAKFGIGVNMPPENGNMVGPTGQGMADLIARDPNATWGDSCKCVQNSHPVDGSTGPSPRVVVIPVYDPVAYADGKAHGKVITLTVVNYIGVFIEDMRGGEVWGRITPILGITDSGLGPAPVGAFPMSIRLVQ